MNYIIRLTFGISILLEFFVPVGSIAKVESRIHHSIGGVYLGNTESQVYRRLGKPIRHDLNPGGCGIDFTKILVFSSGRVRLGKSGNAPFTVESISAQNHNWKTEAGIGVGDSIFRAKKHYKLKANTYDNTIWGIGFRETSLSFKTNNANKITNIDLTGYYC
jgi:hypothetical protein